jgi:nitroreductase
MEYELNHSQSDDQVLNRLLDERFSCRGYLPDQVPKATITRILTLAQRTASWCNAQPWKVTIASGAAAQRFCESMVEVAEKRTPIEPDFPFPREYQGMYLERRRECGWSLYQSVGIAQGDRAASARQALENFKLFGAPHVAIVTTDEALGVYGAVDCGAYVANFMLAARSLGVACVTQASLASWPQRIRSHFDIPEDRRIVCGISFGFPDPEHPANQFRTSRASVDDVVTWVE